jgi:hypothetical protein
MRLLGIGADSASMGQILEFLRPTDSFDPEVLEVLGNAYDMAMAALHDAGQPEVVPRSNRPAYHQGRKERRVRPRQTLRHRVIRLQFRQADPIGRLSCDLMDV